MDYDYKKIVEQLEELLVARMQAFWDWQIETRRTKNLCYETYQLYKSRDCERNDILNMIKDLKILQEPGGKELLKKRMGPEWDIQRFVKDSTEMSQQKIKGE